jgi:uncharacterized protein (TIGR02145 family)
VSPGTQKRKYKLNRNNMKRTITLIAILLLCAVSLFAQTPEKFSYQAVVRNASNALVTDAQVGVRVSILQGSANGNAVYVETHSANTNANGLLTVEIGGGTAQEGTFTDIDWANGPFFLKTETDPNGGSSYTVTSTQQLLSVPYALYSKEAGNGFSGDYNDLTNKPTIPQSVSELANDANYITINDIPEIPTVPTNVSAFNNDTGYITLEQVPAQVNADWNATSGAAQILNKPTLFSGNYNDLTNTPNLFSGNYNDLTNKPNLSAVAYSGSYNDLTNKPSIPAVISDLTNNVGYITLSQVPAQVNADWNATSGAAQILNKPTLFSGDYNDLSNKPTIPTVPTDVSAFNNDAGYLTNFTEQQVLSISHDTLFLTGGSFVKLPASFDGDYNSLTNKPTIPSTVGELTNDANYITLEQVPAQVNADWNATTGVAEILNKPELFSGDYNDLTNTPNIPTVPTDVSAFTNDAGYLTGYTETDPQFNAWDKDYNDLINKPVIPTVPTNVSAFNNDAGYLTEVAPQTLSLSGDQLTITGGNTVTIPISSGEITQLPADWDATSGVQMILNKPTLATVATTGNYNDLTNTPTIPAAANNATLTIQKNGCDIGTFTADASTNQTINVTVPTTTNELTNNSGFITSADVPAQVNADWNATNGAAQIMNKPNIPTNVSQLNNDAGYITAAQCGDVDICAIANQLAQLQQQMAQMQARLDSLEGNTFTCGTSTVSDHEGNVYNTVQIGNQCWTKENLRTTTSPSTGTYLIPAASADNTFTGKQARWYDNDSATYAPMDYGLLYNWNAAVDTFNTMFGETSVNENAYYEVDVNFSGHRRGICPIGWHLPSDAEWSTMERTVSGSNWQTSYETSPGYRGSHAGKLAGGNWTSSTTSGAPGDYGNADRNVSGFSAVPAGTYYESPFSNAGYGADFWSATNGSSYYAYGRGLFYNTAGVSRNYYSKDYGFCVRCVRDDTSGGGGSSASLPTVTTGTVSGITATTATCGGNVTSDGGATVTARGVCWSTSQSPTVSNSHTSDGSGTGSFTSNIIGLTANTTYYVRAYATNSEGTGYGTEVSFTTEASSPVGNGQPCPGTPTVTDHEGNVYNTVQIGDQCWTKENLRTTTSPSTGTYLIPASNANCTNTGKQARWYNNDSATYAPMNYGLLYNWNAAVDTFNTAYGENSVNTSESNAVSVTFNGHRRGICPAGWHLPSDTEWNTMEATVSGSDWLTNYETTLNWRGNHAGKLAGGDNWTSSTTSGAPGDYGNAARNASGFSAVPAGSCLVSSFSYAGDYASFWSATQDVASYLDANRRSLGYNIAGVDRFGIHKYIGLSVRCLRDVSGGGGSSASLPTINTGTVSGITSTTATCGGNVTTDGGATVTVRGVCWSTSHNPTIANAHTINGTGLGQFTSIIDSLTPGTTYYVRAYATNSEGTTYGEEVSFITQNAPCPSVPTVVDYDGNVYNTVQIGNQCWMKQNLRTTHYADGTAIPSGGSATSYTNPYYYNYSSSAIALSERGYLYNWAAAKEVCPAGWHLPSDAEWNTMEAAVSGSDWQTSYETSTGYRGNHAGKLAGGDNWTGSSTSGASGDYGNADRNVSDFSAVPAGYCFGSSFNYADLYAYFWSATQYSSYDAYYRYLYFNSAGVYRGNSTKYFGRSVRCLRN